MNSVLSLVWGCFWRRAATMSAVSAATITILAGLTGAWQVVEPMLPAHRGYVETRLMQVEAHAATLAKQVQADQGVVNKQILSDIAASRLDLARSSKREADWRKLQLEKEQAVETDPVRRATNQHEIDSYADTISALTRQIDSLEKSPGN
jgi:hypothetical protein